MLLAVADGMGGHQSGQVASQMCIDTVTSEFLAGLDQAGNGTNWQQTLIRAMEAANQQISQTARENPEHAGMGTTLTAALLTASEVVVAQVGDSRAYLFHDGALTQLTRDQTIGNSLLTMHEDVRADGRIAEMLVQAVGAVDKLEVELTQSAVEPGDCLMICCDGLYKTVEASSIAAALRSDAPLIARAKELIGLANAAGGPDNITVVLAELLKNSN